MYGYLYMQFRPPQIVNQAQSSLSSTVTNLPTNAKNTSRIDITKIKISAKRTTNMTDGVTRGGDTPKFRRVRV
jgi:hypothetical protein